eukprot:CAMPEP_0185920550 /NCGR_PEP_ID=MMETSP0924C-20121207/8063_1 /TAXON_ID=321610 /ORGANISM="Perkinsus chesapeaki, Strain ATCC PRA-65" /LENGTH=49 /DNA_ID=CAMNT_0028650745 /DNA_START=1 /DNA_END=150 /DNA_ORIENTATION=+
MRKKMSLGGAQRPSVQSYDAQSSPFPSSQALNYDRPGYTHIGLAGCRGL